MPRPFPADFILKAPSSRPFPADFILKAPSSRPFPADFIRTIISCLVSFDRIAAIFACHC